MFPPPQLLTLRLRGAALPRTIKRRTARGLCARSMQDPLAERHDEAGFLGKLDELTRRNQTTLGVVPANQGFGRGDATRLRLDEWLIVKFKLSFHQGSPECSLKSSTLTGLLI